MFPSFFLLRFAKACLFVLKENFSGNLISMISKKKKKKKKRCSSAYTVTGKSDSHNH